MKAALRQFFVFISAILILPATVGLAVAEDNSSDDKAKTEIAAAQAAGWAKFASEIAQYGKAQQDPIALISAARMLKESRVKEIIPDKAAASAAAQPAADVIKEWLDEARKIARESDKNKAEILALADEAGKKTRGYYVRYYHYYYQPTCY